MAASTGSIKSKMRQCCSQPCSMLSASSRQLWGCGLGCAFLANFIFSFSALFVKLTGGRVPVLEVCLIRSSLCWLQSIGLMAAADIRPMFGQRRNLKLLCCWGCCGAASLVAYYVSLLLLPLGDSVTIGLIGPPITAVAARIFLQEPLGAGGLLGCFISMFGVLILSHPPCLFGGHADWGAQRALGTMAGVVSSLLGACSTMIIRTIGSSEPAAVIGIWFHTGTIVTTVLPLAAGFPDKFRLLSPADASLMLGMAATSFVAQLLNTRGLQLVAAAKAAAVGFTGVLYSYALGAVFFHETISAVGVVGVLLILAGVLLVTFKPAAASDSALLTAATAAAATASTALAPVATAKPRPCSGDCAEDEALLCKDSALYVPSHLLALHGTAAAEPAGHGVVYVTATATAGGPDTSGLAAVAEGAGATADVAPAATDTTVSLSGWRSFTSSFSPPAAATAAASGSPFLQGLDLESALSQIAAQAASASAGEMCPAATAAIAASRQASIRTAVLEASRQASAQVSRRGSMHPPAAGAAGDAEAVLAAAITAAALLSRQGSQTQDTAAADTQAATVAASRQPSGRWFGSLLLTVSGSEQQQQSGQRLKEALLDWEGSEQMPSAQQPQPPPVAPPGSPRLSSLSPRVTQQLVAQPQSQQPPVGALTVQAEDAAAAAAAPAALGGLHDTSDGAAVPQQPPAALLIHWAVHYQHTVLD